MALCASLLAMTQKQGKTVACFAQTGSGHLNICAFCNHSMKLMSGLFEVQKVTTVIEMSDKSALPLSQRPPLFFFVFEAGSLAQAGTSEGFLHGPLVGYT